MRLPDFLKTFIPGGRTLSEIQTAALGILSKSEVELSSRDILDTLKRIGVKCSDDRFFGDMERLEDRGYVRSWTESMTIGAETVKERYYRFTM